MRMRNLDEILNAFRHDLPADSKTAQAIDKGAAITEISECAQEEGIQELASILFEAQQEELRDSPGIRDDLNTLAADFIQNARQSLPNSCKTAQAIDKGASWEEISECAEEDGLHELASVLFEAEQERLRLNS